MERINLGIQNYSDWLKAQPDILRDENTGWSVISTEKLGLFNDNLDIYFKEEGNNVVLSDNGDVVANLELVGVDSSSSLFKEAQKEVEGRWGVSISTANGEMTKSVEKKQFVQGKQDILSAMVLLYELATIVNNPQDAKFKDDVDTLMRGEKMNALNDISVYGESGSCFSFDYILARPNADYVIQPFITFDIQKLAKFAYDIEDVRVLRERLLGKGFRGIAILNDDHCNVDEKILRELVDHQLDYVLWSKREKLEALSSL